MSCFEICLQFRIYHLRTHLNLELILLNIFNKNMTLWRFKYGTEKNKTKKYSIYYLQQKQQLGLGLFFHKVIAKVMCASSIMYHVIYRGARSYYHKGKNNISLSRYIIVVVDLFSGLFCILRFIILTQENWLLNGINHYNKNINIITFELWS